MKSAPSRLTASDVTPTTPLRLESAAAIYFPDGGVTAANLRQEAKTRPARRVPHRQQGFHHPRSNRRDVSAMSAPKGIRLWLRPARRGHAATWIIRDGEHQKSTRCGAREIERAEQALASYIAAQHKPARAGGRDPAAIPVADVIAIYADEVAIHKARPKPADARLRKLLEFFGLHMLADVNRQQCRLYAAKRGSAQAARRELEDLRAAINHFFADESVATRSSISSCRARRSRANGG